MEVGAGDPYTTNPGPIDGSVLYDQDKHVSTAVWDGQERGALRCHEHTSKLDQWTLTHKQVEMVEKAGFGYLRSIPAISLDNPLISALVERWRRETNTFHLNVGEMTVTLKDVALLLGLAIDGEPVIGITYTACSSVCEKYLGRSPESGYTSGGMVKLSWLKEFFSRCPEDAPIEVIEQHTRAYLLYLVGSTIFSTTTGNKVPVMYLPLFENFARCGQYAWGAAALAFLYRALGNASLKTQSTISGCLTLLQCWSYFHLNIGRPKLNLELMHDRFPFVLRWKGKQSGPTANRDVVFYRKALDSLKPCDVEWLPYRNMDSMVIPEHIKSTLILGRSKTMLICFDKAERHLPNRCLRQYGMLQSIPDDVERWERKSRGVDGGVDLSGKMESELNEWMDRQVHIVDGDEGVDESEYMEWYLRITRKFIGRPISLSTEFQRTNAGLRDIAHIADTFSTKGLDPQQIESISRIRYIAHECLRDQIGGPVMASGSPQVELGKRVRGKERVRRKGGAGKRMRKDGVVHYTTVSEDEQPQYYGTAIEVGQLHLSHIERELDHAQLCSVDNAVSVVQLIHADADSENMQLCDTHIDVDESELGYTAETFNNIRSALDIREKLLIRQIDAIHHQNRHRKTKLIDQMKFLPDNQENVLAHIRLLGKFNLDNFQTSEPFIVEDYISPNDDHDFMYKGFNGNLESNVDHSMDVSTVLDFSNNKALINENANNINDSIINITLNESRELIEESRELIEKAKLFDLDELLAEPEKVSVMEEEPVTKVKRNSQKIKIHNCTGTINLKNISKLTINTNCRGTDRKDNLTFTTSSSGTNSSTPTGNDANCATYNCEFYNRLINEIKNCIRRSDNSDMPTSTRDSSSMKKNSSSAFTADTNSFDSHCKKILLKNIKNLKIQIPDGDDSHQLSGYLDANTITHPVQIEEWLKQIISETEIEPMQNVEILEHTIINTPSTPTSP